MSRKSSDWFGAFRNIDSMSTPGMFENCSLTVAYPKTYAEDEILSVLVEHFGDIQLKAVKNDDQLLPKAVDATIPTTSVLTIPAIIQMANEVFQDYAAKHGRPPYDPTFDTCVTAKRLWPELRTYALIKLKNIAHNELRVSHEILREQAQLSDEEIAKIPQIAASDSEVDCKNEEVYLLLSRRMSNQLITEDPRLT